MSTILVPPRFNMARYCLAEAARTLPGKPALVIVADATRGEPSELWTFAELERAVLRLAQMFRRAGFEPGARLVVRLENNATYPLVFFGAIAAGLVPVPASSQLSASELDFLLRDSGAAAVAASDKLPMGAVASAVRVFEEVELRRIAASGEAGDYADTAAEDPAYLIYTSGTTAHPKGVLHAQRSALGRSPVYRHWYDYRADDRVLHAGAFNWTYTLGSGLTDPWANGLTSIVYTGTKDPARWPSLIAATGATLFAGVPSLYRQILKYARPTHACLGRLRHGLMAGESPPSDLFDDWHAATGSQLCEALGMSEISTFVSMPPGLARRPGCAGRPQPGRRVAILPVDGGTEPLPAGEEGLLAVHRSDPGLMLRYWNRPDEEAEVYRGDWFIGGDLATVDADGYVAHRGRANDVMKALGHRVSPLEIEAVIARHPDVAEVACAEIQVRADVHVIGAFIVAKPGIRVDGDAIKQFASTQLAAYKMPREIVFVESLPRTANGKIRRASLTALRAVST